VPESKLVLGKHSGRHALKQRCTDLGFDLTREQLEIVYHRFTAAADRKKGLRNDEIIEIVRLEVERLAQSAAE
jgi:2-isopropylmalate synthase